MGKSVLQLQSAADGVWGRLHRVHTRVAAVRLVGEGACFSRLMTHLSVQGRSAGTISFNFQTVHVPSVITPLLREGT